LFVVYELYEGAYAIRCCQLTLKLKRQVGV